MEIKDIKEKSSKYLFQNYGRADLAFESGEGCILHGYDGKDYLDLVAGIAVNALGYAHPDWVSAVQKQAARAAHFSNLFLIKEQADLAEKIASVTPGELNRTLFVNSGAEANEAALKTAVRCTGRGKILSALDGFHGRTSASLGATGQEKYRKSFEPLISDSYGYFEFGNCEQVKSMVGKDTAAVLVEPVQGESGVRTASAEFFRTVRDVCSDSGALMICDEVQTGLGRTGQWYGIENYGVVPDMITMAKALGGGLPVGALSSTDEISSVMVPGTHGTTFGGNPMVCAAGCAVIDVMKRDGLIEHSRETGAKWIRDLKEIDSPDIREIRGLGLMIGIEMNSSDNALRIQKYCRDNGVLINVCHGSTLRLIPPLILTDAQKDTFTALLKECL